MTFNIPRGALGSELVAFAVQARVSISTRNVGKCAAEGHALVGRFTPKAALGRILAGSGCTYRSLDQQAFEIVPIPAAPPTRPTRPAPRADPSTPTAVLSEVVVVATRRPTRADNLAYSVSAVDASTLAAQGVHDTSDVAEVTPAMTVTNLGLGRDKILLRGLSDGPFTGVTKSMVGLYLDDVRLTYNAPDPDLRLVDVDRVEVVRGPQGALYGAGSMGGVVQIITAKPDPLAYHASLTVDLADTDSAGVSQAVDVMVNAPLFDGRAAVRLVGYEEVQGGYIDDAELHLKDVNGSARSGVRLGVRYLVDSRWTVDFGGLEQEIKSDDTQYALEGLAPYTRNNHLREPFDNDFEDFHAALHGSLDWADFNLSTVYVGHGLSSRFDATAAPPVPVPGGPDAFDQLDNIRSLVAESTLASKSDAKFQWLLGAFYAHTDESDFSTLNVLDATPLVAFDDARHDRLDESALFGDVTVPLGADVDLVLGGRLFASDAQVTSLARAPLSGMTSAYSNSISQGGFAPKVVLSYRPRPSVLLYAQAAEGYRPGGFNTTGPPGQVFSGAGGPEPERTYQGDVLWSFEAGGKVSLIEDRLWLRLAGFEAFWKNVQSDELLPSGLPFTANIGNGVNRGVEFEGSYQAGALALHGQFLINEPELIRPNPAFPEPVDIALAAVPGSSAGFDARYDWPLPGDRIFELAGRLSYVGPSQLTFDATTTRKMGDYATGRLAATILGRRLRWTLAVDNPANAHGNTFAFGNPFTVRTEQQVTPLRPRTVSLQVSAAF